MFEREKHIKRHKELHKYFDELIADFIKHTGKMPRETKLSELMDWSYQQTINPAEEKNGTK